MAKQLELVDDGTVIIRNRTQEWVLERPTLGEYRRIVEQAEATDQRYIAAVQAAADDDERVRVAADLQMGSQSGETQPIFGALIREWIELLAEGEPPDLDDLPSWVVSGRAVTRMIQHWRAVPLDLGQSDPAR